MTLVPDSKHALNKRRHGLSSSSEIVRISNFLRSYLTKSGTKGFVLGLSGGVDSSVAAALCVKAVGSHKVLGVMLFEDGQEKSRDFIDARTVAEKVNLRTIDLPISHILRSIEQTLHNGRQQYSRLTLANLKARTRMLLLYALANQKNLLVVGTGDRSEILLGYFTKYGDGAGDILPIAHLYKTEVKALAAELRLPYDILMKPSSPNLWKGQRAIDELPAEYELLDRILAETYENKIDKRIVAKTLGVSKTLIARTIDMHSKTYHKRAPAVSLERQRRRAAF